ncbi:MAG: DUF4365 and DUF1817 domain-containing protein, partial [Bacteroidota bacterium]
MSVTRVTAALLAKAVERTEAAVEYKVGHTRVLGTVKEQRFPKRTSSQATGELGVAIVAKIIRKDLGWEFRRTPQEADFGIDGYIDVVTDEGFVTGRSLAVQVKSGPSYLTGGSATAFTYRGETKHINYYLNLAQPVVLVLVDTKTEEVWWALFEPYETDMTSDQWTMPVKKSNRLEPSAKPALDRLAGPSVDYIPHLEEFWLLGERVKDYDLVCIQIRRVEIEKCYVRPFQRIFERLSASSAIARSAMNKVEFLIDGYNDDPRELYQIPEVVAWLDVAVAEVKNLAFFLHTSDTSVG